ncbi:hypothetical protein OG402_41095 [Streptomyces anulatus]|uniref:hypothetical protein n=1 Tax=Streptomyces anulatus TaxID=1892 RepID=UPI00225ACA9F|nr:hypothetical protein [Streptomyces anulatus]MCX4606826.1 hypothetical protein [Streptomyces anulatus]
MSINPPGPKSTAAPAPYIDAQVQQFRAAIDDATRTPTYHRDTTPLPAIGPTPPVEQPGRPGMSSQAVDRNVTILTSSVLTATAGGAISLVLWTSGQANETVIAWVCGSIIAIPAALTLPVLALKGLMKSAKDVAQAAPAPVHHHYNGNVTVDQRAIHATNRGLIANTRNQLPR